MSTVKVSFETVPQFMAQGHMAGLGARHHGAFGFENVPNSACHGWRQKRLITAHASGVRAKVRHIITHLPNDAHLVHDPVLGGHDVEGNKFPAGHFVYGSHLAPAQSQNQNRHGYKANQEKPRKNRIWYRRMHRAGINFDELY